MINYLMTILAFMVDEAMQAPAKGIPTIKREIADACE
jgi:hypothetical protein